MRYDTVIIGSGVTGLTSALVLAQRGQKVAIVEKTGFTAPLIRRFKRGNVWCDPGFHYSGGFEQSGSLSVLFRYLRMRDEMRSVPMAEDGYDILFLGDREVPIPAGMDRVREALCSQFPKSRKAVNSYIDKVGAVMEATPFINFDIECADFSKIAYPDESLDGFLTSEGAEDDLKVLLGQYGRYLYGVSAEEVPFYIHALVMGTFYRSPQTLANGGDGIVEAFDRRLNEEGVDIFCGSPAVGVEVDHNRRLTGIRTGNGEILECDNCISTIHPKLLADILPGNAVKPAYLSRLRGLEDTGAPFAVYLEVDTVPEKIAYSNMYRLSSDIETAIGVMACDPIIYDNKKRGLCILRESSRDPFPKGLYGEKKRTAQYLEYKKRETEQTIKQLLDFYPDISGRFKVVDSASPLTYERYTSIPNGSMYGVKQSVNQIKLNSRTSIGGFYLAGQSILMPGVMSGVVSGFLGVSNIIGLETLWNEVREWR